MNEPLKLSKQAVLRQILKDQKKKYVNGVGAHKSPICTAKNKPFREKNSFLGQFTKPRHAQNQFFQPFLKEKGCIKSE